MLELWKEILKLKKLSFQSQVDFTVTWLKNCLQWPETPTFKQKQKFEMEKKIGWNSIN